MFTFVNNVRKIMKSVLQQLVYELRKSAKISSHQEYVMGLEYAIECALSKIEEEKEQLCDFWIEGNRQGWEQQTDWPQDAEKFYTNKFGSETK